MMDLDVNKLNSLELDIHHQLTHIVSKDLKIIDAAAYCQVSPSKISKLVKKLGFENFKHYRAFLCGEVISFENEKRSSELDRLKSYIEDFDPTLVEHFADLIMKYPKIVLFGLGPSFICVEYFAYKLNICTKKKICVSQDETHAQHVVDNETLFICFSVTGAFIPFDHLFAQIKAQGAEILLILEEYNAAAAKETNHLFYLTRSFQNPELLPHEKTRTVFFIFIEEVIAKLRLE